MQLHIKNLENTQITVILNGELDALGCRDIRQDLENIIEDHGSKHVEIDLAAVSFLDSSGVGALVFMLKRLRGLGGSIKLTGVQGQPKELLTLLRIDQAIPIYFHNSAA